jgi:cation:H+ antiporter
VAYGTSAPELAVSLRAAFSGQADIAVGNVVGSNIFNVLVVLGASAAIAPLVVTRLLVLVDVPVVVALSAFVYLLGADGQLSALEGGVLVVAGIAYTALAVRLGRRDADAAAGAAPSASLAGAVGLVAAGLVLLVFGARFLVDAAIVFARALGVSELVIALTIVAAGTSLPEVAASVVAVLRGERDIAVGNAVGSNIFNLVSVLGLTALVSPAGVAVSAAVLAFDLPFMIAVALACLPVFATGHRISRWEGLLFLGYYAAYTTYVVLQANHHDALPLFSLTMGLFVVPLTVITLGIVTARELRERLRRRRAHPRP